MAARPIRRTRVTVASVPLVVQPSEDEIRGFAQLRRGEHVTELPPTADDRAAGRRRFEITVGGWRFEAVTEAAGRAELRDKAARAAAEHHQTARITLRAQIPGRVVRLWVADGQKVERGERLLAIEAMKMENEIRSPQAGVVADLAVELGKRVEREDELLSIT